MLTELGIGVPSNGMMCIDSKDRVYCIKKAHERDEFNYVKKINYHDNRQVFSRRFSTALAEKVAGIVLVGGEKHLCIFGKNMLIFFDTETFSPVKRYSGHDVVSVQAFDEDMAIIMTVEAGTARLWFFMLSALAEGEAEEPLLYSSGLTEIEITNKNGRPPESPVVPRGFQYKRDIGKLYVKTPGSILVCSFGDDEETLLKAFIELEIDLSDLGTDYFSLDVMHNGALFICYPTRYVVIGLDRTTIHKQAPSMTASVLLAGGEYLVRSNTENQIVVHKTDTPNDVSVIATRADWGEICELFLSGDRKRLFAVVRTRNQTVSIRRFENPLMDVRFLGSGESEAIPFVAASEKTPSGEIVVLFSTGELFCIGLGARLLLGQVYDPHVKRYFITDRSICSSGGAITSLAQRGTRERTELVVTVDGDDGLFDYKDRAFWNKVLEAVKSEMHLTRPSEKSPNITAAIKRMEFQRLQARNRLQQ